MKKRIFSFLCIFAVIAVFALTAHTSSLSWKAGAEGDDNSPITAAPTSSTTHQAKEDDKPPAPPKTEKVDPPTQQPPKTEKVDPPTQEPPKTEKVDPPTQESPKTEKVDPPKTEPGSESDTTKGNNDSSTTKKDNNKTTSPNKRNTTTTKRYVPRMTIPQVANTTVEGTTLEPLSAYFERISGDSNTFTTITFEETQTMEVEEIEEEESPVSTIAIVAICLGGIALVTVVLTAGFAIRNKRANDAEDAAPDYEQNAYGTDEYDAPDEPEQTQPAERPQVDESDSFTVVSLDDKDYID